MKKTSAYKGHETFHNAIRMSLKMNINILLWVFFAYLGLILFFLIRWHGKDLSDFSRVFITELLRLRFPDRTYLDAYFSWLRARILHIARITSLVWILYPMALYFFKRRAQRQGRPLYLRGAKLQRPRELNRRMKRNREKRDFQIGEVFFPRSVEVKHALVLGRPGAGKTVLLSQYLETLIERGGKGVIYDFKGDYVERFYRPERDLIFNPVDERCIAWNIFNEIKTVTDVDAVVHSLIPSARLSDPFWNDGARDLLAGLLYSLYRRKLKTNAEIWKAVSAPAKDISAWLKNSPGGARGYRYVEDPTSRQALSLLAVMMQYVKSFELLSKIDGDFRISEWIAKGEGWLFVTNDAETAETLRPMISLFVDLIGRRLLALSEDYDRRLFFILDEFGTLQSLSTIVRLLTLSRSKGGSVWLGIQDLGQIDKIYGEPLRQAIVNACGTAAIFSVSDPKTARFLSTKIGETEFLETEESYSMGVDDYRDGVSLMRRRKVETLVLPSEIMQLKDLELFLQIPNYGLTRTALQWRHYPVIADALHFRSDLELGRIMAEQKAIRAEAEGIKGMKKEFAERTKKPYELEIEEGL